MFSFCFFPRFFFLFWLLFTRFWWDACWVHRLPHLGHNCRHHHHHPTITTMSQLLLPSTCTGMFGGGIGMVGGGGTPRHLSMSTSVLYHKRKPEFSSMNALSRANKPESTMGKRERNQPFPTFFFSLNVYVTSS